MPLRKTYAESCQVLREQQLLEGGDPPLPKQAPRDDDEELGVSFFRTELADAALDGLTLPRTFFGRSEIRAVSFRGSDLSESTATWNDFIDVNFDAADLSRADLRASVYERVSFRGAVLHEVDFRHSSFTDCTFADAELSGAKLTENAAASLDLSDAQRAAISWQSDEGEEPPGG